MIPFIQTVSLGLLSVMCLALLYVIILLNGRMYRYFKTIIDDERNQNAQLFDSLNVIITAISQERFSRPQPSIGNESSNRRLRRTDEVEANL